jgi:predicted ATPase/DNA-binding NarL/FixJ family response regulator
MSKRRRESQGGPRRTPPKARGTLPFTLLSDPTPLIGRDRELEVLHQYLLGETVRLLTLTGPGGVGKTRLAVAAARCVESAFPGGVWFVDLVPLRDPTHIDAAIAQALQLGETSAHSSQERITAYLKHRRVLLVLDNFEHVLPAAPRVGELVATCPHLRVLVTSREPLNLRLEHVMILPGLALPDLARPTPESIAQAASSALFLERARLVQPDFAPTPADAQALAELVHRLDGMPLAIQIAAARSRALSPAAMLERLQGPALLSMEEARDAPARHHTLRATIEWSHALLTSSEQMLFRQLGIFAGGWTLDAAEEIVQGWDPVVPLWGTLGSLVEKSLVQTEGVNGADRRYRMLETIREYALERLGARGELDTARQRHAAYYLALAERAEPEVWGPEERAWLRRVEQEHENFRAALQWATDREDGETAMRLGGALAYFWWALGYLREGRRWLEQALALGPDIPSRFRARALEGAATLASSLGDHPVAQGLLQHAIEFSEALADSAGTARALTRLGMVAAFKGDAREAQALLERSLALWQEEHELRWQAHTLFLLGGARILLDDLGRAEAALTESLDLCRTLGNRRMAAADMSELARIKLKRGDDAGAAVLAASALNWAREQAPLRAWWFTVAAAALVSAHLGNFDHAVRLLAAGEAWSESTGDVLAFGTRVREEQEKITAQARDRMDESAYRTAVTEGRTLSVDEVAGLARAGLEPFAGAGQERVSTTAGARPRVFFSDREQAILRLVAEGLLNKQIATSLGIGERTVKSHLTSAMRKLGVDTRAQAAVAAVQRGLL